MRRFILATCSIGAVVAVATVARADRVVLVGGTVLEGRAVTKNGKVVVETEAGEVAVPADSVSRIERSEPAASRFESRYAALQPGDVQGRLELADYCRNHDMKARERKLLFEVLGIDKDNERARARLGYVKTDTGWVTEDEAMHAKGFVRDGGRWVSRGELVELERLRMEREAQERADEAAASERHARSIEQSMRQAEIEEQRSHLPAPIYPPLYRPFIRPAFATGPFAPVFGPPVFSVFPILPVFPTPVRPVAPPPPAPPDATTLSVVKVPYRRH
jgi:hypothetical protein